MQTPHAQPQDTPARSGRQPMDLFRTPCHPSSNPQDSSATMEQELQPPFSPVPASCVPHRSFPAVLSFYASPMPACTPCEHTDKQAHKTGTIQPTHSENQEKKQKPRKKTPTQQRQTEKSTSLPLLTPNPDT